jgi:GLPGLI family protein
MKAKILLLITAFSYSFIQLSIGQGLTGRAYYKTSSNIKIAMDSTKMAPEQMAEIQAQLKKQMEKEFILDFTQTESNWKQVPSLGGGPATASSGGMQIKIMEGTQDQLLYKNMESQSYIEEQDLMGKGFLVKDSLTTMDWELTGKTKQIGNYACQEAKYSRIIDAKRFSTGMEEMETVKDTVSITAWFTPQIPVSHGPNQYWGLPGLILEVQNEGSTIICQKIVLNPSDEPVEIEVPDKGKEVNRKEFMAIQEEQMQDMMKRYSGKPGEGDQFTIRIGN